MPSPDALSGAELRGHELTASATPGPLLDEAGIRRTLTRLAHEIVEANAGVERLVLVGIQRRGVSLARRIAAAIEEFEVAPPTGALDVTMHRDDFDRRGLRGTPQPTELPEIEGQHVVLVDDVLFTGRTIRAALDALNDYGRPHDIRLAVLIDRGHRELPIRADMVGKNIPTAREDDVRVLLAEDDGRDAVIVVLGGNRS
jgi:pyrimidine operon attenuation protein/uracil phosphoribosyltransferase